MLFDEETLDALDRLEAAEAAALGDGAEGSAGPPASGPSKAAVVARGKGHVGELSGVYRTLGMPWGYLWGLVGVKGPLGAPEAREAGGDGRGTGGAPALWAGVLREMNVQFVSLAGNVLGDL
jgi:hypothetical protein